MSLGFVKPAAPRRLITNRRDRRSRAWRMGWKGHLVATRRSVNLLKLIRRTGIRESLDCLNFLLVPSWRSSQNPAKRFLRSVFRDLLKRTRSIPMLVPQLDEYAKKYQHIKFDRQDG